MRKTKMWRLFSPSGADFRRKTRLDFCSLPIPARIEPRHFLLSGTTGAGKTLALRSLLDSLRQRGDRALILDPGGDLLWFYFRAGSDAILAPGDARSLSWSPWAEIRSGRETADLAKSIIPDGKGEGREWASYAQVLLAAILRRLLEGGKGVTKVTPFTGPPWRPSRPLATPPPAIWPH